MVLVRGVSLSFVVFFFFSSRRRHTRYWRDWSSDVCSSDLHPFDAEIVAQRRLLLRPGMVEAEAVFSLPQEPGGDRQTDALERLAARRSEERRVGKECRSRWSRYQ